jgi:hypothetical protein
MRIPEHWSRRLLIAGVVVMVLMLVDPLEGSPLGVIGAALVTAGALSRPRADRTLSITALLLVSIGVAAMWIMSSFGGIGGTSGHSMWWALILLPYPIGWLLGLFGGVRMLRRPPLAPA